MKYLYMIIYFICFFIITNLISSILYYFNITSSETNKIIKTIILIILFTTSSLYLGYKTNKKGYLEGLKISITFIIISLLTIIFIPSVKMSLSILLYYLFIIVLSLTGSMIGINIKKNR